MKTAYRLDNREWADVARSCKLAEAAIGRVEGGLFLTTSVKIRGRWFRLAVSLDTLKVGLVEVASDQLRGAARSRRMFRPPANPRGLYRTSYLWTKPPGLAKRPLTAGEWATIGDDARRLQGHLSSVGHTSRAFSGDAESDRWYRLAARVETLRHQLATLAYRQTLDLAVSSRLTAAA